MSPSRPSIRIRPRSAIADPELARAAVTDLPGSRRPSIPGSGMRVLARRAVLVVRSAAGPLEPDRVIVMPLATVPVTDRRR